MVLKILRKIRSNRILSDIRSQENLYRSMDETNISQSQLRLFNSLWSSIKLNVPYYREFSQQHSVASSFKSWQEFVHSLPIVEKMDYVQNSSGYMDSTVNADQWRATGGSTYQPVRVPSANSEIRIAAQNIWLGRYWLDIMPEDRAFLLWGHGQLFGKGISRQYNIFRRNVADWILGYVRGSAYELDRLSMQKIAHRLIESDAKYIIGFSGALEAFAQVNNTMSKEFKSLNLSYVIATGESFSSDEARLKVESVLSCPVVMEYGAVETGPLAYELSQGHYKVFWNRFYLEALPDNENPGLYKLLVTTLYPRKFPLVRYRMGDFISNPRTVKSSLVEFAKVVGREQEFLEFADGSKLHVQIVDSVLRHFDAIDRYQIVNRNNADPELQLVFHKNIDSPSLAAIKKSLVDGHSVMSNLVLKPTDSIKPSISGKQLRVLQ